MIEPTWMDRLADFMARRISRLGPGTVEEVIEVNGLHLVKIRMRYGGGTVQCRPLFPGMAPGQGLVFQIPAGTEAWVLIPEGKTHRGVALLGAMNGASQGEYPPPGVLLYHPNGVKLGGYGAEDRVTTHERVLAELQRLEAKVDSNRDEFVAHNHTVSGTATTVQVPPAIPVNTPVQFQDMGSPDVEAT